MSVESVFSIRASPTDVFAAIERDLGDAREHEGSTFEVLRREPPGAIDLRVTIGGVSCWLTYRIEEVPDGCEIHATLVPFGFRYALFKVVTLGMREQNFKVMLVHALANLKADVEGANEEAADDSGDEQHDRG